jgi:hypothetical protein
VCVGSTQCLPAYPVGYLVSIINHSDPTPDSVSGSAPSPEQRVGTGLASKRLVALAPPSGPIARISIGILRPESFHFRSGHIRYLSGRVPMRAVKQGDRILGYRVVAEGHMSLVRTGGWGS